MKLIKISPPGFFLICLLAGLGLHFLFPQRAFPVPFRFLGIFGLCLGLSLHIWPWRLFKIRGTTVHPPEAPTVFVVSGPYRYSRNPMYVGLVLMMTGISLAVGTIPMLFSPFVFFLTLDRLFIPHEEKNMEKIFGQAYLDYKKRVRRWV